MIIKSSDIKSVTLKEIMVELYNNLELMDEIVSYNLRGGDYLEAIATELYYDDNDIDTRKLMPYCK